MRVFGFAFSVIAWSLRLTLVVGMILPNSASSIAIPLVSACQVMPCCGTLGMQGFG